LDAPIGIKYPDIATELGGKKLCGIEKSLLHSIHGVFIEAAARAADGKRGGDVAILAENRSCHASGVRLEISDGADNEMRTYVLVLRVVGVCKGSEQSSRCTTTKR
jgi:hypothetical protein